MARSAEQPTGLFRSLRNLRARRYRRPRAALPRLSTGPPPTPGAEQAGSLAALVASIIGANDLGYEGPLPVRPPVLCAGCPHRGSFYAVKQALRGREAVLCGDIGCYTLGNAQPLDAVDTCLCMGAGITMAQGFAVAEPDKKQVAFVGDSTFFASAMTGIANAVYNGHDVTFAILDNATTAMTGSQPHPGTGVTLMGERRRPIVIEEVLHGLGIQHIGFANPHSLESSVAAARAAIDYEGPVGHHLPCAVHSAEEARCSSDDRCRQVHRLQEVHHLHRVPWHRLR